MVAYLGETGNKSTRYQPPPPPAVPSALCIRSTVPPTECRQTNFTMTAPITAVDKASTGM